MGKQGIQYERLENVKHEFEIESNRKMGIKSE